MTKTEYEQQVRLRAHHLEAVKKLAQRIPRLRSYALTDNHWLALAALHAALAKGTDISSERFIEAVQRLERFVPKLFRVEIVEPRLPQGPKDPVTGEVIGLPDSKTERALMQKNWPQWYAFLLERERSPVSQIIKLDEQRAKFAMLKVFEQDFLAGKYDDALAAFKGGDHAKQAALFKNDPILAELVQAESRSAAALPFDPVSPNETILGQISKEFPQLYEAAETARQIATDWSGLEKAQADADFMQMVAVARQHGYELQKATGRRERHPMKSDAPLGSPEQTRRQHEAAMKASNSEGAPLTGRAHEIERRKALKEIRLGESNQGRKLET